MRVRKFLCLSHLNFIYSIFITLKSNLTISKLSINQEIISKLKARQEDGLRLLYSNYSEVLYGMSFRILRNEAFAEDALQKSFLKIWNSIESYDDSKSTLFTWMAKIVKNTSIDISRLRSFQKEAKTDTLDPLVHKTKSEYIDTDAIDVKSLLDGMEEKYKVVIEYLYLRGYSQSELSKELNLPLGTIKSRSKKAIDLLREKLKKEDKLFYGGVILLIIIVKLLLS